MKAIYPVLFLGGALGMALPAAAATTTKTLAPGITFTQEIDGATPLVIDVVKVDLTAPGVHVEAGPAQDRAGGADATHGREDVSRYARRHHALVAVNADFFPFTGDPLGVEIHHGELFSEPWTGNDRGGPRVALGIQDGGRQALIDRLGFLGDLQCPDGSRGRITGLDRAVGKGEIVAFSPSYGGTLLTKPGGTCVVLSQVNLPLKANKLMSGVVTAVHTASNGAETVPADGVVISGGPGAGADFLAAHVHAGDRLSFALGIGSMAAPADGVKVALLPRDDHDMPSRAGAGIDRTAVIWGQVAEAVGGGPRLLSGGEITLDASEEGFDRSFSDSNHPRTAVGIAPDGHTLIIVTVDGRQDISRGVSLTALAGILKRYGASDAMNLDGGGSTVMAVDGVPVDSPGSSGEERPVADMLTVYSDQPSVPIPDWDRDGELPPPAAPAAQPAVPNGTIVVTDGKTTETETVTDTQVIAGNALPDPSPAAPTLSAGSKTVPVGSGTQITAFDGGRRLPADSPDIIWQGPASSGVGFVNQAGYFTALKPGTAVAVALYHGQRLTTTVTVIGHAPVLGPAIVRAALSAAPSGAPNRQLLSLHVADADGHAFASKPVKVSITGGVPDADTITTDEDGDASVGITWDGPNGGTVVVAYGASAPVTLTQGK